MQGHEHRRRSKTQLYAHLVWATAHRQTLLEDAEIERRVHRCIHAEAERLDCAVIAVNGMPDHVHLLVQMPAKLSVSRLAQAVKGISSKLASDELSIANFDWQDHYAAFSVSRKDLDKVANYVKNQKRRHASGQVWPALEETDEAVD